MEKLVVSLVGGWNGGEKEGKKNCINVGKVAGFLADFGPDFLPSQAMK